MVRRFTRIRAKIKVFALLATCLVSTLTWAQSPIITENYFSFNPNDEILPGIKEVGLQGWGMEVRGTRESPYSEKGINSANWNCPCSVFTNIDSALAGRFQNGATGITLGMKFKTAVNGYVTAIRFYKTGYLFAGTRQGYLYDSIGGLVGGPYTFTETASGWQRVNIPAPGLPVTANRVYTAAYYSSSATTVEYTASSNFFVTDTFNGPLTALSNANAIAKGFPGNGVYNSATGAAYPATASPAQTNYWVDVVFQVFALPVQLTKFTAAAKGNNVQLGWTTESEQKNKGFEIQRSSDGSDWTSISFVGGTGTSQLTRNYQFLDKNLSAGKYYYRLNQLDLDGHSQFSRIVQVAVSDHLTLEILQNHPNPFNNSTFIDIIIPRTGRIKLMLYDQMGRPVRSLMDETKNPGSYQLQVDRKGLSAGVYYYKLEADGQSLVKKMTIL